MKKDKLDEIISKSVYNAIKEASNSVLKRKYINRLYKNIEKSKLTSHLFNDEAWLGVKQMCEVINSTDGVIDYEVNVERGGYRRTNDGAQWKEYNLIIEFDGNIIIRGVLNCHAAGTMDYPFSRYDMTITFW